MTDPSDGREGGQTLILVIGYVAIALLAVSATLAATAVNTEARRLLSVADGAVVAAADSFSVAGGAEDTALDLVLTDAAVRSAAAAYVGGTGVGGRVSPMEYRISEFEPPRRVVLVGSGSGVLAVDEIRFEPAGTGTTIDYSADIRLGGLLRLAQPLLRGALARVARKAGEGMRLALADRARAAAVEPADPR